MKNAIQGFERVMVSLMMLAVILVCANLYFTMDRRQAQFESKVTDSLNGLSGNIAGVTTAKMDALTTEVHGELAPISAQTTALLTALTGKVSQFDVVALNKQVIDMSSAVTRTTEGLTAAVGNVNATVLQVNDALPYIIDCDPAHAGADCLPNRYLEIAGETESALKAISNATPSIALSVKQAAGTVAIELPKITANVDGVTDDVHSITTEGLKAVKAYEAPPTRAQKWAAFGRGVLFTAIKYFTL